MNTHRDFDKHKDDYLDLSDFFAGERQVKEKGERYTPRLEGHKTIVQYEKYKNFGILYNALSRTRQGLKGAILRKPIDIQFQDSQLSILDKIMLNGASFNDLTREICDAVLGYGRCGVLVDIDEQEQPYTAFYNSLSILNWPSTRSKDIAQEILLQEMIERPKIDDPDKTELVPQMRKLEIDGAGYYMVSVYQKKKDEDEWLLVDEPRYPTYKGKHLDYIPFIFFGSSSNIPTPSRPPLLDLLNLLKGHWRLTVAYQYGLHFAGLPTPCFAGFNIEEGATMALGPGAAYHTSDPSAKSWFLQTGGSGLSEIVLGLNRLETQMAVIGARLLEEQRPGIEAAETVRLRSSGDSATLSDIAGNIEAGLTDVLQHIGFWLGISEDQCTVAVNKDFVSTRLSPQDVTALLQGVQAGKISEDTFIYNLIQGEILQDGRTIEEEKESLEEDRIKTNRTNPNLAGLAGKFF